MAVVSWLSNDNEVTKNKIRDDNIAPIELNASSASKTYTVGKRFVLDYDGKLYKATQQINQGSAIITSGANANCEEVTEKVLDTLGTASTKNSTSVVTDSTDLVESGAVEKALGFGNKNLSVPYTYSTGGSEFSLNYNNNKVTVNGTLGDTDIIQPISSIARNNGYMIDLPAGTYTISLTGDTANIEPQIVKSNGSVLEGTTVTLDAPTTIFVRVMVKKNNTFNNQICYIQLEKGSTATAYEPYHASVEESKVGWNEVEGYVGKNLYNNTETVMSSSAGSVILNNNGGFTLKGTGQYTSSKNELKRCEEGKKYILSAKIISSDASDLRLGIRNSSNTFVERISIGTNTGIYTVPFTYSNGYYAALTFNFSGTSSEKTIVCEEIMVREEGTPSDYVTFIPSNTELSETKCDNSVIGTVEGANASKAWSVGEHFISGGQFKEVTQPIASGGAISDSNTVNKPIADCLSSKANVNNFAGTISALTAMLPNAYDNVNVMIDGAVISTLTNSSYNIVSKITAYHTRTSGGVNYMDWYGMVGSDGFCLGRYNIDTSAYVSHKVATLT